MKNCVSVLSSVSLCLIAQNAHAWIAKCDSEKNNGKSLTVNVSEQDGKTLAAIGNSLLPCVTEASGDLVCMSEPSNPPPGAVVCGGVTVTFTVSQAGEMTLNVDGWGMSYIQEQYTCALE